MSYRKSAINDWKGVIDNMPSLLLPAASFKSSANWYIDKGRLKPFPSLCLNFQAPSTPFLGMRTFQDQTGATHSLFLSRSNPYFLQQNGTFLLLPNTSGGAFSPQLDTKFSIEVMLGRAFFVNGGAPLAFVDGSANYYTPADVPGTSFYLGKLAGHLMMVNCVEPAQGNFGSQHFPARVRWSASGNPLEWNQAVDQTAGAVDIEDVEDELTGWATVNNLGYAFRNNGITTFTPTGLTPPFGPAFRAENFSIGSSGIGCYFPYTLAVYGTFCVFVSLDDIYLFDGSAPQPIGTSTKKSIFADIQSSTGTVFSQMVGSFYKGIDYLSYWLICPQDSITCSVWIYHFNSHSWMNLQLTYGGDVEALEGILVPNPGSAPVTNLVFDSVAIEFSANTYLAAYHFTSFTGASPLVGMLLTSSGFGIAGNNVVNQQIVSVTSGATGTVRVAKTTQSAETHAGAGAAS